LGQKYQVLNILLNLNLILGIKLSIKSAMLNAKIIKKGWDIMNQLEIMNKFSNGELLDGDIFKCGRHILEVRNNGDMLVSRLLDHKGYILQNKWTLYKDDLQVDFTKQ